MPAVWHIGDKSSETKRKHVQPGEPPTAPAEEICSVECVRVALVIATSLPPPVGLLLSRITELEIQPIRRARREHDITRQARRRQRTPRHSKGLDTRITTAEGNAASLVTHIDSRVAAVVRKAESAVSLRTRPPRPSSTSAVPARPARLACGS